MSAVPHLHLSPAEFLEWEARQDQRHEYHRGDVFAMAGGTEPHARIITNLVVRLSLALQGTGCTVCTDALRVRVEDEDLFTYPDLSVVCGPGTFYDERRTTLLDPVALVEVLSPSTEQYDRTTKWRFYRQIESLQAYVLVSQDAPSVDVLARSEAGWTLTSDTEGRVSIPTLDVSLKVAALYEGVEFPGADERDRPAPRP